MKINKFFLACLLVADAIFAYGIEVFNQPNNQGGGFIAFGLVALLIFAVAALSYNSNSLKP